MVPNIHNRIVGQFEEGSAVRNARQKENTWLCWGGGEIHLGRGPVSGLGLIEGFHTGWAASEFLTCTSKFDVQASNFT